MKRFFEDRHKWNVITTGQQEDFGTDGQILIFKNGCHNQQKIDFQLKSTETINNEVDIEVKKHLDMWNKSTVPFFLFFWSKPEDQIYFINLHDYYGMLSRSEPEKLQQKYILVKFTEKLDDNSFEYIERTVDQFYEFVGQAIQEHRNEDAQIKDFFGKEKIIAMGYSFVGHNVTGQVLRGAALMGENFEKTTLLDSDMRSVSAMGANFNGADLRRSESAVG